MNTDENSNMAAIRRFFSLSRRMNRRKLIERLLPSQAILFLFERKNELRIDIAVEKRSKEMDYVVIEIADNEQWAYLFELLLDNLTSRYGPSRYPLSFQRDIRSINSACKELVKLKV